MRYLPSFFSTCLEPAHYRFYPLASEIDNSEDCRHLLVLLYAEAAHLRGMTRYIGVP